MSQDKRPFQFAISKTTNLPQNPVGHCIDQRGGPPDVTPDVVAQDVMLHLHRLAANRLPDRLKETVPDVHGLIPLASWLVRREPYAAKRGRRPETQRLRTTEVPDPNVDIETALINRDLIRKGMAALTPREQSVLLLWAAGNNAAEIAQLLQLSVGAVDAMRYRALKRLRGAFDILLGRSPRK